MVGAEEVNFPRGGHKVSNLLKLNKKSRPTFKLFGNKNIKSKNKKKNINKKSKDDKKERFNLDASQIVTSTTAELLTYKTLQEGMIVLACIREINKMGLSLSLPGRLAAKVPITHISQPYTNILKNIVQQNNAPEEYRSLSTLFSVGQYVRCKIIESLHSDENYYKVTASISPHDIQSDWKYTQLKKGLVITVAVSSEEDYGYVMDTGIQNTRAFLPKKNVHGTLEIGQTIWCNIVEVTVSNLSSTIVLNAKSNVIFLKNAKTTTIQDLLPGMRVPFTVEKKISDGLEGKFFNDFTGYISSHYLEKPIQDLNKYNPGDTLEAYIMYIMPTTKLACLTLCDISTKPEISLKEGYTTTAKVLSRVGKGLYLKLSKNEKGFVSYNRLKKKTDDIEQSLNAYQTGSSHQCRVLDFDYMERIHICTLEKQLVNEKYFSVHDLNVGELVPVVIEKIKPNGIEVKAGRLTGFVKTLHVSDIILQSTSLNKKFQIGQKVNARVLELNVENKQVKFTLKPSLVESDLECLTSLETVNKNLYYLGVVVQITNKGILVTFYGELRGWIPTNQLNLRPEVQVEEVFYIGQVVKCRVLTVNLEAKKMTLTLNPEAKQKKVKSLKIGQIVQADIASVTSKGIEMTIPKVDGKALLPVAHLSDNLKIATLLLEHYKTFKRIKNLMCIGATPDTAYLSLRETKHFKNVPNFESIKEGSLLRCSFKSVLNNGLLLFSPIKNFRRFVFVPKMQITDDNSEDFQFDKLNLNKYQPLMAKVIAVDKKTEAIIATTKLSECWDKSLDFGVNYLEQYLKEIDIIRECWKNNQDPLGEIKLGQRIKSKISYVFDSGACNLELSKDLQGVVIKEHNTDELKVKQKTQGVVLWVDFHSKNVTISLLKRHQNEISEDQGLLIQQISIGTIVKCEIILIKDEFALGVMFENGNKQFLFLPTILHYNDFTSNANDYEIGSIVFAKISKIVEECWYIGILKVEKMKKIEQLELITNKGEIKETETIKNDQDNKKETKQKLKKRKIEEPLKTQKELDENVNNKLSKKQKKLQSEKPVLSGMDNFWSLTVDAIHNEDDNSKESNEDEEVLDPKKKKKLKSSKLEDTKSEEARIQEKEIILADSSATPTSVEQFDRLVLAEPNNSHIWINYMAFHLQSTEIEKARSIAKKALNTISFREEQEKLNVWIAYLNLENRYGTKQSFLSVLDEATKMNDSRQIHMRALHILADSKKQNEFNDLLNVVLKKYKHLSETWQEAATHCFQLGLTDKARHLLQRALTCLDKKLHINFLVQFAYLEVKYGNQERAETLFEQVLGSYPNRVDIWCSYIDMLVKASRIDVARKVLDSAVSLQLNPRKMKTLFKKYIDFETTNGNEERVQQVREMAVKYVQRETS